MLRFCSENYTISVEKVIVTPMINVVLSHVLHELLPDLIWQLSLNDQAKIMKIWSSSSGEQNGQIGTYTDIPIVY